MKCKKHKRYKGILRPRTRCTKCWLIYLTNRVRKFLGLQVPIAKPRVRKPKFEKFAPLNEEAK
jgi:hypothetical protein